MTPLEFSYYPISQLLAAIFWGLLVAVVHRSDLSLYPGSSYLMGFGLWSSLLETLIVELLIFSIGVGSYLQTTQPVDRTGAWALWTLVLLLLLIYLGNLFGPPPPNVTALAWIGQAQWILVIWGYWVDRHNELIQTRTNSVPPVVDFLRGGLFQKDKPLFKCDKFVF